MSHGVSHTPGWACLRPHCTNNIPHEHRDFFPAPSHYHRSAETPMTNEHATALVAAILLASPQTPWTQDNPKSRERAIDAAARLVKESRLRYQDIELEAEKPA